MVIHIGCNLCLTTLQELLLLLLKELLLRLLHAVQPVADSTESTSECKMATRV